MAGEYAVPAEIRAMRPKGTTVKKLRGGYYVYETSSTTVKVVDEDGTSRWKTKTKSGPCIGKIVPGVGFVPNGNCTPEGVVTTRSDGGRRSDGTPVQASAAASGADTKRIEALESELKALGSEVRALRAEVGRLGAELEARDALMEAVLNAVGTDRAEAQVEPAIRRGSR